MPVGLETGQFEVDERVGCGTQVMHARKVVYGRTIAYQETGYPGYIDLQGSIGGRFLGLIDFHHLSRAAPLADWRSSATDSAEHFSCRSIYYPFD